MPEMFDAVETLGRTSAQSGDRLTILTNGGGPGVLATDALVSRGGVPAKLGAQTLERLNAILPPTWSHGNPVDMIGDAGAKEYRETLGVLLDDRGSDAILVLNCPTALSDPSEAAKAVIETIRASHNGDGVSNVFTSWLGEYSAAPGARSSMRPTFRRTTHPTMQSTDSCSAFATRTARRCSQRPRCPI